MSTNTERFAALLRVVEFAKANGFPRAETAFWDPDDPERAFTATNEALEDEGDGNYELNVGVYLHEDIRFIKTIRPEGHENEGEYSIEPSEGVAP